MSNLTQNLTEPNLAKLVRFHQGENEIIEIGKSEVDKPPMRRSFSLDEFRVNDSETKNPKPKRKQSLPFRTLQRQFSKQFGSKSTVLKNINKYRVRQEGCILKVLRSLIGFQF